MVALLLGCMLALTPDQARAAWPTNPAVNVPVCTAAGVQTPGGVISDGQGGMFVAWGDTRTGTGDIYVQHMSVSGTPSWLANGKLVCGAAGEQDQPALVADGTGGVIVAWRDYRLGVTGDIYAQRLDAGGNIKWALNGVPVCTAAGEQGFPVIISDERTLVPGAITSANPLGAIIAWEDWRANISIRAQRVDASGAMRWIAGGMLLSTSPAPQFDPAIAGDGAGGAFVVWSQQGNGNYDIGGQHIEEGGALVWGANGAPINGAAGAQVHPVVCPDGAGGAIVVWEDHRNADSDLYAQRLTYYGVPKWSSLGVAICGMAGDQWQPAIAPDGSGGVLSTWTDQRAGDDIYAQRTTGTGLPAWTAGGIVVGAAANVQQFPSLASDGHGGALIAWEDYRSGGSSDIYAQRLTPFGLPAWALNGQAVSNATGNQYGAIIVADGDTVGIVAWTDQRAGGSDLYAQQVPTVLTLDVVPSLFPGLVRLSSAPNPSFGPVTFAFTLGALSEVDLTVYDAAGRSVRTLARGMHSAGAQTLRWDTRDDAGRACAPGAYWARLRVAGVLIGSGAVTLAR